MASSDARPPPGVCGRITEIVGSTDPHRLREFARDSRTAFDLLLHHAAGCRACRRFIDIAFPDGFVTPEGSEFNQAGLDAAEQLLRTELAEMGPGPDDPGDGNSGTRPRGGERP